jgi:hypothetical protein
MLTEIISREMESFELVHIQNYLFLAQHDAPAVQGSRRFEERISKTESSSFICLNCFAEMHFLFDMGYAVGALSVCAEVKQCTEHSGLLVCCHK